eukprot:1899844-Alexandrium_andersonii.AAC.1
MCIRDRARGELADAAVAVLALALRCRQSSPTLSPLHGLVLRMVRLNCLTQPSHASRRTAKQAAPAALAALAATQLSAC